jgi:hypothetical protein
MLGNTDLESLKPTQEDFNDKEEYEAAMQIWLEQEDRRNK